MAPMASSRIAPTIALPERALPPRTLPACSAFVRTAPVRMAPAHTAPAHTAPARTAPRTCTMPGRMAPARALLLCDLPASSGSGDIPPAGVPVPTPLAVSYNPAAARALLSRDREGAGEREYFTGSEQAVRAFPRHPHAAVRQPATKE